MYRKYRVKFYQEQWVLSGFSGDINYGLDGITSDYLDLKQ